MAEVPDHGETHEPPACGGCGSGLEGAGLAGTERRQVFYLPPLRLQVTEHRLNSRTCGCGVVTKAQAPVGVNAPVQYGPALAGVHLFHGRFLSKSRTCQALGDLFAAPVAASTVVSWVRQVAAPVSAKVLPGIVDRIAAAPVAHFDETGFRTAGSLHWMHSASTPTDVLLTVHRRRGTKGMDAAGVLPRFTGTAVHDAWAPYDTYTDALHALCNAHALRELVYVIDTAGAPVAALAQQGATAMLALKDLVENAAGVEPDAEQFAKQRHRLRSACVLGRNATAGRAGKLERKYHVLFTRLITRWDDCRRYTTDPRIPWDNNRAEQTIRMPKLRIKVSGSMRTLTGAEEFAAIRSYTATALRNGQNMLDVLIQAANHNPWILTT